MAKRSGCPPYVKAGRIRHLVLASGGVRLSTRRLRDRSETTQGLRFEALRRLVNKEPAQRTGGRGLAHSAAVGEELHDARGPLWLIRVVCAMSAISPVCGRIRKGFSM